MKAWKVGKGEKVGESEKPGKAWKARKEKAENQGRQRKAGKA